MYLTSRWVNPIDVIFLPNLETLNVAIIRSNNNSRYARRSYSNCVLARVNQHNIVGSVFQRKWRVKKNSLPYYHYWAVHLDCWSNQEIVVRTRITTRTVRIKHTCMFCVRASSFLLPRRLQHSLCPPTDDPLARWK